MRTGKASRQIPDNNCTFADYYILMTNQGKQPGSRKPARPRTGAGQRKAEPEPLRLNKYIANSGICSRREADKLIEKGEITVNGKPAKELGTKVKPSDKVAWKGKVLRPEKKLFVLLNKPRDYVTTTKDPHAEKTVMDFFKDKISERIYPVGRLDKDSTGLLLFTNDGEIARKLSHPSQQKKKIYHVTLNKVITKADMEKLATGIELEEGIIAVDAVAYAKEDDKSQIGIEIHTGQNRVIRRMMENLGYRVKKLDRVYYAGLTKKNLPRGKWRFLSEKEINMLRRGTYR